MSIEGPVDHAHAALAELRFNPVMAKGLADHWVHVRAWVIGSQLDSRCSATRTTVDALVSFGLSYKRADHTKRWSALRETYFSLRAARKFTTMWAWRLRCSPWATVRKRWPSADGT